MGSYSDTNTTSHGFVRNPNGQITTFDVPGAVPHPGTYQGTYPNGINEGGTVVGYLREPAGVHGFVRNPNGDITTFDAPGANATRLYAINQVGAIVGSYLDAAGISHGFLLNP